MDICLGALENFLVEDSDRFVASFRSYRDPSLQCRALVFRFEGDNVQRTWHAIENECPHASAPLEHADIEDTGDSKVLVCPFHSFDFDLNTGLGETHHLKACTWRVYERDDRLYMQRPGDPGDDYRLLGVRPISQRFPDTANVEIKTDGRRDSVRSFCNLILSTPEPREKVALVRELSKQFRAGALPIKKAGLDDDNEPPAVPPRTKGTKTVQPTEIANRGKVGSSQNRIKLLHALAHIELWAIDLAIDVCTRFVDWKVGDVQGKVGKRLANDFFGDFIRVAEDEAKHFSLLTERIEQLGGTYPSLPVHDGLWESAMATQHSLLARLSVINLVHEARGLDVNPKQIERCAAAGDHDTAAVLDVIHNDEITHVSIGHRHFMRLCKAAGIDAVTTFRQLVQQHFHGGIKGPYNERDRDLAGLSKDWYHDLKGSAAAP